MVRNSADHGLEIPAERAKAGKPEIGTVSLNAFHEGGHIIIEIADDGKGLSVERIKAKCLENGLASEADLENKTRFQRSSEQKKESKDAREHWSGRCREQSARSDGQRDRKSTRLNSSH